MKVGDIVVCVDLSEVDGEIQTDYGPVNFTSTGDGLVKDKEYVIEDRIIDEFSDDVVSIEGIWRFTWRFRKVEKNPLTKEEEEELESLVITTEGIEKVRELETV